MTFWNRCAALALPLALLAAPSEAALLSITVVEGPGKKPGEDLAPPAPAGQIVPIPIVREEC